MARMWRATVASVQLAVTLWIILPPGVGQAQSPEFRAMWVTRFEWPSTNSAVAQARIDAIMGDLAASNFNAVFVQVRGQADTLYPSPFEVWSPLIGGHDPGWDPLAYAVNSAHANGIEFHAYINTHTCWQGTSLPANPEHLFYEHCNAADPDARDWLIHDSAGAPVQFHENDYVWIAPGVPAFQAYLRQQICYVVENYDVDGVHFDRIRTPNSLFSYDPISVARLNNPQSNPEGLGFHEWTADQITRNVRDIYAAVMTVKPHVKVSAAVFPNPSTAPTYQHQDARAWAQSGGLDLIVPMCYFTGGAGSTWDTRLQQWLAGSGGRHVVMGHHASEGFTALLEQIALTRLRGGHGNTVFSWSKFDSSLWNQYRTDAYPAPTLLPAMSWKNDPTTGIICGFVTDAQGTAVIDAQVVRTDSSYKALSTGDGFYSFLLVPPGTYTLTVTHPDQPSVSVPDVVVTAGQVARVDIGTILEPRVTITADPAQVSQGGTVHFTPTVELPIGDSVISHEWDFGDGGSSPGPGAPSEVDHPYCDLGIHQAHLEIITVLNGSVMSNQVEIEVRPVPPPPADFDRDGDVDQEDFGHFQACLTGPALPQNDPDCQDAKLDGDSDVDQTDFSIFRGCVSGPNLSADPHCAD